MSNFMQKIRKNEWTVPQVLHVRRFFDVMQNASTLKSLTWTKLDFSQKNWLCQFRVFMKYLAKNQKKRLNGSLGTAWTQIFWHNIKCLQIKIPNLIKIFSKKLIMSISSIYEFLTSCKKSEKTNRTALQRRFFDVM